MAKKLTPKQQGFCYSYIETGNASEAYRLNYNAQNMKPDTIRIEACKLLENPNITLTLEELRLEHKERHLIDVDNLTDRLTKAEELGLEIKNPAAAVAAIKVIAQMHGLITNKQEVDLNVSMSDQILEARKRAGM